MTDDFYDLLEVPEDASQDEIKEAFREKVQEYHPDLNDDPRAQAQFTALKKAYDTLGDPSERNAYERLGHEDYVAKRINGLPSQDKWATDDDPTDDEEGAAATTGGASGGGTGGRDGTGTAGGGATSAGTGGDSTSATGSGTASGSYGRSSGASTGSRDASGSAGHSGGSSSATAGSDAGSDGTNSRAATGATSTSGATSGATSTAGGGTAATSETSSGTASATGAAGGGAAASSTSTSATGDQSASTGVGVVDRLREVHVGWPHIVAADAVYVAGVALYFVTILAQLRSVAAAARTAAEAGTVAPLRGEMTAVTDGAFFAFVYGTEYVARVPLSAKGVVLVFGSVLLPLIYGISVRRTRRWNSKWNPTRLYVVATLAPLAAIGAHYAGAGYLGVDVVALGLLPVGAIALLPLSAFVRPKVKKLLFS